MMMLEVRSNVKPPACHNAGDAIEGLKVHGAANIPGNPASPAPKLDPETDVTIGLFPSALPDQALTFVAVLTEITALSDTSRISAPPENVILPFTCAARKDAPKVMIAAPIKIVIFIVVFIVYFH